MTDYITLLFLGLWHTVITYFTVFTMTYVNPTYLHDNTPVGHWTYSTCIFHIVTLLANLQVYHSIGVIYTQLNITANATFIFL